MREMIRKWTRKENEDKFVFLFILLCFALSRAVMFRVYRFQSGNWSIPGFIETINTWDSPWYRDYAESLFRNPVVLPFHADNGQAACAFFPLYPFLVGLVHWILPFLPVYGIGTALSSVFFMISNFVAYRYIRLTRENKLLPYMYIFLMSMGPYTVYFSVMYTESLFLMLLILCFYYMEKEQFIRMGICGSFLSATRNVGVFFCFCLLVYWLVKCFREQEGKKHLVRTIVRKTFANPRLILGAALIPLGLFVYMLFLKQQMGDMFAFVHIQRAWGKTRTGLLNVLLNELIHIFPPSYWSVNMILSILLVAGLFPRKRYAEALFPAIVLVLAGMTSLASMPRYMIGSFTVMLGLCEYLTEKPKLFRWTAVTGLVGWSLLLMLAWMNHSPYMI